MISFKPPLPAARVAQALAEVQLILVPTGVKAVAGLSGASRKNVHSQGVVVCCRWAQKDLRCGLQGIKMAGCLLSTTAYCT